MHSRPRLHQNWPENLTAFPQKIQYIHRGALCSSPSLQSALEGRRFHKRLDPLRPRPVVKRGPRRETRRYEKRREEKRSERGQRTKREERRLCLCPSLRLTTEGEAIVEGRDGGLRPRDQDGRARTGREGKDCCGARKELILDPLLTLAPAPPPLFMRSPLVHLPLPVTGNSPWSVSRQDSVSTDTRQFDRNLDSFLRHVFAHFRPRPLENLKTFENFLPARKSGHREKQARSPVPEVEWGRGSQVSASNAVSPLERAVPLAAGARMQIRICASFRNGVVSQARLDTSSARTLFYVFIESGAGAAERMRATAIFWQKVLSMKLKRSPCLEAEFHLLEWGGPMDGLDCSCSAHFTAINSILYDTWDMAGFYV